MPDLRDARREDAATMSALALCSKAHWGYDDAFLAACRDELAVDPDCFDDPGQCWRVAVADGEILAFFGLAPGREPGEAELEALFVLPDAIGTGLGRRLINDATAAAKKRSFRRIIIQGDPNASDFYVAVGARAIGERESGSIPGRYLPLFALNLDP